MTKRLYFTCPIKSLYMMKEFGVIICKKNQDVYNWNLADLLCVNFGRIYVAPESEHIFEPQEGDIGLLTEKWSRGEEYYIVERKHWGNMNFKHNYKWFKGKEEVCTTKKVEITMRDNKQFFMPEVENER